MNVLGIPSVVRSIFLALVGLDWCDVLSGEVNESKCSTAERDLFYILDQVPILAFFAIYALLVQFWAEVYYNAVDKLLTLTGIVKPAIRYFIVVRLEITAYTDGVLKQIYFSGQMSSH